MNYCIVLFLRHVQRLYHFSKIKLTTAILIRIWYFKPSETVKRVRIRFENIRYVYQCIDEIAITSRLHVSAVKQPSSGQCKTYTRYNITVHCVGSNIVYKKV